MIEELKLGIIAIAILDVLVTICFTVIYGISASALILKLTPLMVGIAGLGILYLTWIHLAKLIPQEFQESF